MFGLIIGWNIFKKGLYESVGRKIIWLHPMPRSQFRNSTNKWEHLKWKDKEYLVLRYSKAQLTQEGANPCKPSLDSLFPLLVNRFQGAPNYSRDLVRNSSWMHSMWDLPSISIVQHHFNLSSQRYFHTISPSGSWVLCLEMKGSRDRYRWILASF